MYAGNLHKFQSILARRQRSQTQASKSVPAWRNSSKSHGILHSAIEEIRRRLPVKSCQFLWHHPDRGLSTFNPGCQHCSFDRICSGCVTPNPLKGEHLGESFESWLLGADDTGRSALLSVALKMRSGERGVLVCERGQSQPKWRDEEVALLRVMAHRLTLAIDRICQAAP